LPRFARNDGLGERGKEERRKGGKERIRTMGEKGLQIIDNF